MQFRTPTLLFVATACVVAVDVSFEHYSTPDCQGNVVSRYQAKANCGELDTSALGVTLYGKYSGQSCTSGGVINRYTTSDCSNNALPLSIRIPAINETTCGSSCSSYVGLCVTSSLGGSIKLQCSPAAALPRPGWAALFAAAAALGLTVRQG